MRKVVVAVVSVLFTLASCDSKSVEKLEEGVSTEADVRAQFGEPVAVYPDASDGYGGGAKTLEYPRQPEGQTTYMIAIGSDGKMSALRQVLKPSEFAKVTPGLDTAQVRRLLGRPASTQRFELKNEEQWNWRWLHGQAAKVFSVTFDPDGRVITTAVVDDPRCLAGRVRAAAPSPPARLDGANSACRPSASSASRGFLKPTPAFNVVRLTQWTLNPAARGFSCHRMRAGITYVSKVLR